MSRDTVGKRGIDGHMAVETEVRQRLRSDEAEDVDLGAALTDPGTNRPIEASMLADEGVEEVLDAGVEQPNQRQPGQAAIGGGHQRTGQEVRCQRTNQRDRGSESAQLIAAQQTYSVSAAGAVIRSPRRK